MNKQEFLQKLGQQMSGLSSREKEERLNFYREMIDDRMEDGLSEEEAVCAVGSVDIIAGQITEEISPAETRQPTKRRLKAWEIVLLILGSPIWFSLLIAALAVVLSLYVSLWAVLVSAWAVFASAVSCAFALLVAGIVFLFGERKLTGIAIIGTSLVCAGLSVFLFFGCKAATKGFILLTKKTALGIKHCFTKKEVA
ncbi:MAG: DUF1700 domain-containing protein [Oscillospiraceae bacterium]|nr:DUF1700 domain-containing protein [Oscillospiraceae bacterium]